MTEVSIKLKGFFDLDCNFLFWVEAVWADWAGAAFNFSVLSCQCLHGLEFVLRYMNETRVTLPKKKDRWQVCDMRNHNGPNIKLRSCVLYIDKQFVSSCLKIRRGMHLYTH